MDLADLFEWNVLRWVLGAGVVWACWLVLKRLFAGPAQADPNRVVLSCSCGWTGTVSRLKPRCSKCGAPLTLT